MRGATLLLLAALALGAQAFYDDTDVTVLTPDNFDEALGKGLWLVEFYAPWCGHCKNMKEEWKKAATALKGVVGVGAVDADAHKDLAKRFEVRGFPTLMWMAADAEGKPQVVEKYSGGRKAKEFVSWALKKVEAAALEKLGEKPEEAKEEKKEEKKKKKAAAPAPAPAGDDDFYTGTDVVVLTDKSFRKKVLKSKATWLVEFYAPWCGHCKRLKSTWIELAAAVKGKAKIGAVDCTVQKETCEKLGVQGFPTLKKFDDDKEKPEDYEGDRSLDDLTAFATGEERKKKEESKEEEFYVGTDVVVLTADNFEAEVLKSDKPWLVEFYAPWCGHCKNLKPGWIELAKSNQVKGRAKVGAVDCTKHNDVCKKYGVQGFPTIKKFGDDKEKPQDYEGNRAIEDLISFLTGIKPSSDDFYSTTDVVVLTAEEFEEKVLKSKDIWLVKFYAPWCGHCKTMKPNYAAAAAKLKGKAQVGSVDCTGNRPICEKYEIKGFPTLKKFGADKEKAPEEYSGNRAVDDLVAFATGEKPAPPPSEDFYSGTDVVVLTKDDFEDKVTKSKDTWLVEFYAPWCGHCKNLKPTWIELATAVKGKASIGAVDCTQHRELCNKFEIRGFPTLKKFGDDKAKPEDYSGGRTVEDLSEFATGQRVKGKAAPAPSPPSEDFYSGTDVVVLTDKNFKKKVLKSKKTWLVEFYAPWCGHCKSLKPEFIQLGKELKKKEGFAAGAVDCTQHKETCSKFGVHGYPTLKKFGDDKDKPEDYSGDRSSDDMFVFLTGDDSDPYADADEGEEAEGSRDEL